MKKVFLLITLALFSFTGKALAQVDVGLLGGINHTSFNILPEPPFEEKSRPDFGCGLFVNVPLNESLSTQVQGMYLRKGGDLAITGINEDVKVVAEYLEFPVLLRYTFNSGNVRPYYFAGPSIGFLLKSTQKASFIPANQEDNKADSKKVEFSLCVGGGLQYVLKDISLYAQIMYMHGLTNNDNVDDPADYSDSIRSRSISYMVGVSIPLGRK